MWVFEGSGLLCISNSDIDLESAIPSGQNLFFTLSPKLFDLLQRPSAWGTLDVHLICPAKYTIIADPRDVLAGL